MRTDPDLTQAAKRVAATAPPLTSEQLAKVRAVMGRPTSDSETEAEVECELGEAS